MVIMLRVGRPGFCPRQGQWSFFFIFSLHQRLQTGSEAHRASYPICTWRSYLWVKTDGAWSLPLISI